MAKSQIHKVRETHKFLDSAVHYSGDECLPWPFCKGRTGYGQVVIGNEKRPPHRVVCERVHGPEPESGMHAAHSCGNRACCNPKHLRWATVKENALDRILHGTVIRGERAPWAKVTAKEVLEIRNLSGQLSQSKLAKRFGVTQSLVSKIVNRHTWKHI